MKNFSYFFIAVVSLIFLGGIVLYFFEKEANPDINSFWDGMWLVVGTATLLGYGDIAPVTLGGRIVSVVLMFVGIALLYGVFTALFTRYAFENWWTREDHRIVIDTKPDSDFDDAIQDLKHLSHLNRKRLEELEYKFEKFFKKGKIRQEDQS